MMTAVVILKNGGIQLNHVLQQNQQHLLVIYTKLKDIKVSCIVSSGKSALARKAIGSVCVDVNENT